MDNKRINQLKAALSASVEREGRLELIISDKQEVLDSLAGCIVSQPRDFSLDHKDAWLYWILLGWGDAEKEILKKHNWDKEAVLRLKRLRTQALKEK